MTATPCDLEATIARAVAQAIEPLRQEIAALRQALLVAPTQPHADALSGIRAQCQALGIKPTWDGMITEIETSKLLSVAVSTLRNRRSLHDPMLAFEKRGRRILYSIARVDRFLAGTNK